MAFNLDELFVDPAVGEQGVWVPCFNGSRLKLAYSEAKKYKAALAKLARQHRLELDDTNEDSYDIIQHITATALAEHVLLDWEGILVNGQEAAYTKELGREVLRRYPKLREFVTEKAAEPATFRDAVIEKVKKP